MRVGFFTDTYHPSLNGIVYVVDIMRRQFEAEGHEVYVLCQVTYNGRHGRDNRQSRGADPHVIRLPAFESGFFEDYGIAMFFPPHILRRIKKLNLDIVIFFTPGQVGLMGTYAAKKLDIPLIAQHSTDLYEYVEHYPMVIPGIIALAAIVPFTIKMKGKDAKEWLKSFRPRRKAAMWGKQIIEQIITLLYQKCDVVVTVSRKSYYQLNKWKGGNKVNFTIIPTGVDQLPVSAPEQVQAFRAKYKIAENEKVLLYVGRISPEKNLEVLIPVMELILHQSPATKLLLVGDFEYREILEGLAQESTASDNIIFTGRLPREELGAVYAAADIFVFPSVKDTQGLVLAEAALAGLPVVMIDEAVTEVVRDGINGIIADNSPIGIAKAIQYLLDHEEVRLSMASQSPVLAAEFTELKQTQKLIRLCENLIKRRELKTSTKSTRKRAFRTFPSKTTL